MFRKSDETTTDSHDSVTVTLEQLIKLRSFSPAVKLTAQRKIHSSLSGGFASRFRGRGIDFDEVRLYQPGDDIRNMDWRVTARTGKAHTKLFHEERERPVFFVVDSSASMLFGSRVAFKSVIAAKAAALLAWAALDNHDRVGGVLFSSYRVQEIKPQGGTRGVLRLLKTMATIAEFEKDEQDKNLGLDAALTHLRRVSRPGSLVFILSDFYSLSEDLDKILLQQSAHNEIVIIYIFDPLEAEPPPSGHYRVSDGMQSTSIYSGDVMFRKAYRDRFISHSNKLITSCRLHRVHFLSISTADDIVKTLHSGMSVGQQLPKCMIEHEH